MLSSFTPSGQLIEKLEEQVKHGRICRATVEDNLNLTQFGHVGIVGAFFRPPWDSVEV